MDDRDVQILELANATYRREGFRIAAAFDRFGLTQVGFWARVNAMVDDPTVMAERPDLVLRLRRVRDRQQALRAPRAS